MSIVLEDSNLNVAEQVNVLFKSSLGFPSTKESTPWFQETSVKYNNYVNGEEILLDEIPSNPSFSVTPNLVDVNVSSSQLATGGYIKEDSTRVIRQYHRLILTPVPNSSNNSYYALDSEGNNILTDGLQFNTKWSGSGNKIYPYTLYTQAFINADSNAPNELGQDSTGGNWLYDLKNGVIFFPDYSSSLCNGTTNKPVFSFYKYIGRKGVAKQIDFKNSLLDIPNTTKKYDKQIVVQTSDNTIHRYDSATTSWIPIGGSGAGWEESATNSNDIYYNTGNIGIGTETVSNLLHIESTSANALLKIKRTSHSSIYFGGDAGWGNITSDGKLSLKAGDTTNNAETYNSPQLLLDTNGSIGIGTTNPTSKLEVYHNSYSVQSDIINIRKKGHSTNYTPFNLIHLGTASPSHNSGAIKVFQNNTKEAILISGNGLSYFDGGNVGIGTNNPYSKLHVSASHYSITDNSITTPDTTDPTFHVYSGNFGGSGYKHTNTTVSIVDRSLHNGDPLVYRHLYGMVLGIGDHPTIGFKTKTNGGYPTGIIELKHGYSSNSDMSQGGDKRVHIDANGNSYFKGGRVGIGTSGLSSNGQLDVYDNRRGYSWNGRISAGYNARVVLGDLANVGATVGSHYFNPSTGAEIWYPLNINPYGKVNICRYSNYISIGTSAELAKVTIDGTKTTSITGRFYARGAGESSNPNFRENRALSLYAADHLAAHEFHAHSDIRIKENIVDAPDDLSLSLLRDISCCYYNYIDRHSEGSQKVVGFIAQQVKKHFPIAVSYTSKIIPNEMRLLENIIWEKIDISGSDISGSDISGSDISGSDISGSDISGSDISGSDISGSDISGSDISSNEKYKLTIPDLNDLSGNSKYRFYVSNNDVSGNNEVQKDIYSLENDPNSFIFDQSWNNVFLYGKEVDDFHILCKNKLFAINFSATQEIDRIQQQQILDISQNKVDIESLKIENDNLKLQNSTLTTKVNNLQSELTNLKSIVQGLIEAQMSS